MTPRVVMFTFAGRQPNMELQFPLVAKILAEHPNVEFDVWNLARTRPDNWWLRAQPNSGRMTIRHNFYKVRPRGYNDVYRYYAGQDEYADALFVKLDDDVVFLQTDRFAEFIDAIDAHRDTVLSANVINNGACAKLTPSLYAQFQVAKKPLLDWHRHARFAELAHDYFFEHSEALLAEPMEVIPTDDWLSINMIGCDWLMLRTVAEPLGSKGPFTIAGRRFSKDDRMGDEGRVNQLPRAIVRGFVACHLMFGPQQAGVQQLSQWRARYSEIGDRYLSLKAVM